MNNPIIDEYGTQYWYNSYHQLHRADGPAIIYSNGTQSWHINDKLHRTDGPAIVWADGTQFWYINNRAVFNNKEFQQAAKISDEEMTLLILKYGNI